MDRINKIIKHPLYIECLSKISVWERDRIFCRHDMSHFLDVARIAQLLCRECDTDVEKETVYAAALLHDIGRWRQYEDKTSHEIASSEISRLILPDCDFTDAEIADINAAILAHRTKSGEAKGFPGIFYRADKLSRICFSCAGIDECDWELKNTRLEI